MKDKFVYIDVCRDENNRINMLICPENTYIRFREEDKTYTHAKVEYDCVVGDIQPLPETKTTWACSEQSIGLEDVGGHFRDALIPPSVEDLWGQAWQHRYFIHHSPSWDSGTIILDLQGGKEWEEVISWYQNGHPKVGVRVPGTFDKFWKRHYILDLETFTAEECENQGALAHQCWPYISHSTENVKKLGVLKW